MAKLSVFTEAEAAAILAAAADAEIGVALVFEDDTDLDTIRTELYKLGAAKDFQISLMDNPIEIWIIKKTTDLERTHER